MKTQKGRQDKICKERHEDDCWSTNDKCAKGDEKNEFCNFYTFVYTEHTLVSDAETPHEIKTTWAKCERCPKWDFYEVDDHCGTRFEGVMYRAPVQSITDLPERIQELIKKH